MAQEAAIGLDSLQNAPGSRKDRVRRARGIGSGLGKTAGRGGKGQTARTGKGRPRGFEGGQNPLYRRLPKFGFNSPNKVIFDVVNVSILDAHFQNGDTVDIEALVGKGLVKGTTCQVKILGEGNLTKKLTVRAHGFSKSAVQKINQAGGKTEELKAQVQDKDSKKQPSK